MPRDLTRQRRFNPPLSPETFSGLFLAAATMRELMLPLLGLGAAAIVANTAAAEQLQHPFARMYQLLRDEVGPSPRHHGAGKV
jgi:hypothetical protein